MIEKVADECKIIDVAVPSQTRIVIEKVADECKIIDVAVPSQTRIVIEKGSR